MITAKGYVNGFKKHGIATVYWIDGELFGDDVAVKRILDLARIATPMMPGANGFTEMIVDWMSNPVTAAMIMGDVFAEDAKIKIDEEYVFPNCPEGAVC